MLPASVRLRSSEVERVLKGGISLSEGGIRLKALLSGSTKGSRFAVIVSKKVAGGSAVERNRLRREVFGLLGSPTLPRTNYDVALMLTKAYTDSSVLAADLSRALQRLVDRSPRT